MRFRGIVFSAFLLAFASPMELQAIDTDGDGFNDAADNCPGIANSGQTDDNDDGIGDVCPSSITGGDNFFCIDTNGGNIKCWGENDMGQLGNGNTTNQALPQIINFVNPFKKTWAEDKTTCTAIDSGDNDKGYCWGQYNDIISLDAVPVQVPFLNHVVVVKSSNFRRCAIAFGGKTYCWGQNDFGQTGDEIVGASDEDAFNDAPFEVPGVNSTQSILLGRRHTCVVANGNKVLCWGTTDLGVLGIGQVPLDSRPATQVPGLSNVNFLTGGDATTCAVMADNSLKCWGITPLGVKLSPTTISAWNNVKKLVKAEGDTWCFLRRNGTAACNGDDPPFMPMWSDIEDIAFGGFGTSCAIRSNGSVWCWGANSSGQLGVGTFTQDMNVPPAKVHF